jgi:hypothetical protein
MSTFEECIENLFGLADQVTKYNGSGDLGLTTSNVDPIGTKIRKYKAVYGKTKESTKHLAKFQEVYMKCRSRFLQAEEFDVFMLWFESQSFTISATDQVYFPLSIIFRKCCTISRNIDEQALKDSSTEAHVGSTYPEMFMLHLFRLFIFAAPAEDQTKVALTVKTLEETLGLTSGDNPDPVDGLADVVGMASDVISDMGVQVPKGAFNAGEFKKAIGSFTKNSDAKNTLKKMFSGIKLDGATKDDIPKVFSKIFEGMQQNAEQVPEPLQRSMNATVENPTGQPSVAGSSS